MYHVYMYMWECNNVIEWRMWGSQTEHILQTDLHAIFIMRDTMYIQTREFLGLSTIHNTCDTLCSEETEDEMLSGPNHKTAHMISHH